MIGDPADQWEAQAEWYRQNMLPKLTQPKPLADQASEDFEQAGNRVNAMLAGGGSPALADVLYVQPLKLKWESLQTGRAQSAGLDDPTERAKDAEVFDLAIQRYQERVLAGESPERAAMGTLGPAAGQIKMAGFARQEGERQTAYDEELERRRQSAGDLHRRRQEMTQQLDLNKFNAGLRQNKAYAEMVDEATKNQIVMAGRDLKNKTEETDRQVRQFLSAGGSYTDAMRQWGESMSPQLMREIYVKARDEGGVGGGTQTTPAGMLTQPVPPEGVLTNEVFKILSVRKVK